MNDDMYIVGKLKACIRSPSSSQFGVILAMTFHLMVCFLFCFVGAVTSMMTIHGLYFCSPVVLMKGEFLVFFKRPLGGKMIDRELNFWANALVMRFWNLQKINMVVWYRRERLSRSCLVR